MTTCTHCNRTIVLVDGRWIDPEATGDDSIWRETCDSHDTFVAEHEPDWQDATTSHRPDVKRIEVGLYTVTVCLDDEGPLRPAYYWDIETTQEVDGARVRITNGWAGSVEQARKDAVEAATGRYTS